MIQLIGLYHQNRWQRLLHSDFWLYEISVWLHTFSRALIAVFIPIFIIQIGYTIQDVIIYYVILNFIDVPLNFLARWLIVKIGAKWTIIIASFFSLAFFASLYALKADNWGMLLLVAIFAAFYDTLYWVAHIYLFMKASTHNSNVSQDNSFQLIIKKTASILAPALGAALIIVFGRRALIVVSMIFIILSIIPLFMMKKVNDRPKKKLKSFFKFFKNKELVKDYLMAGFWSIHCAVEEVIWPLFIYVSFSNIQSVALLPIMVSITSIIFIYFAGQIKKRKREKLIIIASISIAFIWILRLLFHSPVLYYISVILVGLAAIFISIPLYSSIYEKGEKMDALNTSTYRNTTHMVFRVIVYSLIALMVNVFKVSFIIAAVSMIMMVTISYVMASMQTKKKRFYIFNR